MFLIVSFVSSSKPLLFNEICAVKILKEMVNDLLFYHLSSKFLIIPVQPVNSTLNSQIYYSKAQTFLSKLVRTYKQIHIVISLLCIIFHYFTSTIIIPVCLLPTRDENLLASFESHCNIFKNIFLIRYSSTCKTFD